MFTPEPKILLLKASRMSCRLCLCKIEDMLDPEFATTHDNALMKQIKVLFDFEMMADPNLPQIVCKYCADRVKSFYEYHQEVLENQKKLGEIMQNDDEVCEEMYKEPEIEVYTPDSEEIRVIIKRRTKKVDPVHESSKFVCHICPCLEPNYISWKNHMKSCHNLDDPVYLCCGAKFFTERGILVHINKCHSVTKKRKFSCDICLNKFEHKSQIRKHMVMHQKEVPDGYHCKKCTKTFQIHTHWRTHQLIHCPGASLEDIGFPCKKCPEELPTLKDLQAHKRHQHKKKFLCDLCAQVFYMKHQLKCHLKRHLPGPPPRMKCPHCEKGFLTKGNLTNHIRLMHVEKGRYPCDKCDKVAITKTQLANHIQYTHQLVRNFKCQYCPKAFKRMTDVEDHESVHTGIKRHICPKCERKFGSKSNMQSHAKKCKGLALFD